MPLLFRCISIAFIILSLESSNCANAFNIFLRHHNAKFKKSAAELLTATCILSTLTYPAAAADPLTWQLPNGQVQLSDPITTFSSYKLQKPYVLLGSGGGGAVFSTRSSDKNIALKISWVGSAPSVERECQILNVLEEKHTRNVETCLGVERYPPDPRRVMIALEPVVDNTVASVAGVNPDARPRSVRYIVQTLVDMLAANVVTTDVQPLMNKETGAVLFIDMTEAQIMSNPPSFLDLALASSFCAEMASLIPEDLGEVAAEVLVEELKAAGVRFSNEIYEMLQNQSVFMSPDTIEYIESMIAASK